MILKIDNNIHNINLESCSIIKAAADEVRGYLILGAGIDQYKLLSSLSLQLPKNSIVGDLGTFYGNSAIALSYNSEVYVMTCDPTDYLRGEKKGYKLLPNIAYHQCAAFELLPQLLDAKLILVDIALHDGLLEEDIYNWLIKNQYKGIVVFDDIHFGDGMEHFWGNIKLKKFDVTKIGHWSGTGVVVFSPEDIDIEVDL